MVDTDNSFEVEEGVTLDASAGIWIGGGVSTPTFNAPQGSKYLSQNGDEYKQEGVGNTNAWVLQTASVADNNIDGGFANSLYLPDQCFDGGGA